MQQRLSALPKPISDRHSPMSGVARRLTGILYRPQGTLLSEDKIAVHSRSRLSERCPPPVRLEFPILSLHPGLRSRGVAPDVWGRRVAGGGAAAIVEEAGRPAGRLTGGTPCASGGWRCRCGGRPAGYWDHAATNRQSAANRALISRLLGVHRPFIGCDGARQRCTHVAEPFADTFPAGRRHGHVRSCSAPSRPTAPPVLSNPEMSLKRIDEPDMSGSRVNRPE